MRAYREANKLKLAESARKRYLENHEDRLNKARIYRAEHIDQVLETARKYYASGKQPKGDPVRLRDAARKRRAALLNVPTYVIEPKQWNRLVWQYRGLCAYCKETPWEHRDHVIPITRGGSHGIGNLVPACSSCNISKSNKTVTEWKLWKRRLNVQKVWVS